MQRIFSNRILLVSCVVALRFCMSSTVAFAQASTPPQVTYTFNWAGYGVQGKTANQVTYTDVKGSWIVPNSDCSKVKTSSSAIWVGIGGIDGGSYIEQIGTTSDCNNGVPNYTAWYEMLPDNPVRIDMYFPHGFYPGDRIDAEVLVTDQSNGDFLLRLVDNTHLGTLTTQAVRKVAPLNSAEWIVEDPHNTACGKLRCPLTEFGTNFGLSFVRHTIHFSACSANGQPITANPLVSSLLISTQSGQLKASPSILYSNGTSFNVFWAHS